MIEASQRQNTILAWISWQFFDVPKFILQTWRNFLLFNLNYFSIPLLFKTLFSHWHRYRWSYGRGLDIPRYLEAFFSNLISRILGAIMRIILIVIGLLIEIFIFFGGIIIFFGWLMLPVLLLGGIWFGLRIIF